MKRRDFLKGFSFAVVGIVAGGWDGISDLVLTDE